MMMQISRQNRRRARLWPYAATLAVLALFAASYFLPMPPILSGAAHLLARPVQIAGAAVVRAFAPIGAYTESREALLERIRMLEELNDSMRSQNLLAQYLLYENRELREALSRPEEADRGVLGAVLAGPGRSPYDTLVIDAGSERGVELGGLVVTTSGFALGFVASVHDRSALVSLFSSPSQATRVVIGTTSPHATKAVGVGGGAFAIELPRETPVAEGNPILLPGVPPILLGTVERIIADPTNAYQTVRFTNPVNVFALRYVVVLPPPPVPHAWDATLPLGSEESE